MSRMASRWVSVLVWVGACLAPAAGMLGASAPPIVEFSTRHGKSARLRDHRPNGPVRPGAQRQIPNKGVMKKSPGASLSVSDPVAQRQFGLSQPEASIQFEGLSDDDNAAVDGFRIVPPDTEGDVGPDHYFQYINDIAAIYDKSGNVVLGPFAGNAFWAGPRRPLRGSERRRPARALRPPGRSLGRFAVRASRISRMAPSTSASRSRRRTIRPASTTSTSS